MVPGYFSHCADEFNKALWLLPNLYLCLVHCGEGGCSLSGSCVFQIVLKVDDSQEVPVSFGLC